LADKELVILAGSCFPVSSATGTIAINFGKYLQDHYHVSLIAIEQDGFPYRGNEIDGIEVYTISNWRLKWAQKSKNKRDESVGMRRSLFNLSLQMARLVGRIQASFFSLNNNAWYISKAYHKLEELNEKTGIDIILTCASPHEAHWAGFRFKDRHPETRWVSYWGDLLASKINHLNLFVSIKRMKKMEIDLCNASDCVLTTEENYHVLVEETADPAKVKALPYTLNETILNICTNRPQRETIIKKIVYMGSFYRDIRNPDYFLNLFCSLPLDYCLLLYCTGNCEDIVSKYEKESKGRIVVKGLLPKKQLISEVQNADILINIQNKLENSNPSKIFELVSYGKPIVDFSYSDDVCSALLHYPCCLNVNMNRSCSDYVEKLSRFIADNAGRNVDLQQIREIYSRNLEINATRIVNESVGG
jgi:hypothetical protein